MMVTSHADGRRSSKKKSVDENEYLQLLYKTRRSELFSLGLLDDKSLRKKEDKYGNTLASHAVLWHKSAAMKAARSYEIARITGKKSRKRMTVGHILGSRWPSETEKAITDRRILRLRDTRCNTVARVIETKIMAVGSIIH